MRRKLIIALVLLVGVATTVIIGLNRRKPAKLSQEAPEVFKEVLRADLFLRDGKFHEANSNLFTGLVIERHANENLRSRSSVSNGLLEGLSEGWFTNGQLQMVEHFVKGVSEGERKKFYATGQPLSRTTIVNGEVHGVFEQWHTNGALALRASFEHGRPHGVSEAWFADGFLRSRVVSEHGKVIESQFEENRRNLTQAR